ncbi:hypothetical protein D3C81_2208780 [compost metagenome]
MVPRRLHALSSQNLPHRPANVGTCQPIATRHDRPDPLRIGIDLQTPQHIGHHTLDQVADIMIKVDDRPCPVRRVV